MAENTLHKTCISCGLQKPITAFLQISGPNGTIYGNACSTCRGSGAGKVISIPDHNSDDERSGSTGIVIDAKTKTYIENEKKQKTQRIKDGRLKEREKLENDVEEKFDRKSLIEEAEDKHRKEYIEPKKKEGFLSYQSGKPFQKISSFISADHDPGERKLTSETQTIAEATQKSEASQIERRNTTEDFSGEVKDQHTAQINRQNPFFSAWEAFIGDSAAINTVKRQFLNARPASSLSATPKNPQAAKAKKDSLVEFINENWEPKSPTPSGTRRRR